MKNIFKFLGIALVASSMLVACGDGNEGGDDNQKTKSYTIKVKVNDSSMGTATLKDGKTEGVFEENSIAELTATANAGYTFVSWEDGSTFNPRQVAVKEDATYTATFAEETGVRVKFGETEWKAGYVNAQLATNAILVSAGQTSATSMPMFKLQCLWAEGSTPAAGTVSGGNPSLQRSQEDTTKISIGFGNPYIWYYESSNIQFNNGTQAGDWWGKNVSVNITTLDADAMLLSLTVNTVMAHMTDIITAQGVTSLDVNQCTTRDLTLNIKQQSMTRYTSSKAALQTGATYKIK